MLEIEQEMGARCSYYFRLRTLDVPFMKRIEAAGGEASYHYEEISDFIIQNRIKSRGMIQMDKIRESFRANLTEVRKASGLPCVTVASHGEWANRRLGICNKELLNEELREETGIIREAYDEEAMKYIDARFADQGNDTFINEIIKTVDETHAQTVYILTHPAQWRADLLGSLKLDCRRIADEIFYRF